jgi:hypothetical protein
MAAAAINPVAVYKWMHQPKTCRQRFMRRGELGPGSPAASVKIMQKSLGSGNLVCLMYCPVNTLLRKPRLRWAMPERDAFIFNLGIYRWGME